MRDLKALILGTMAAGVLAYSLAAVLAVTSQASGHAVDVALGPVVFVSVVRQSGDTVTTFGFGIAAFALLGGLFNLAAARVLNRRAEHEGNRVD